jgi:single-stranded DNA-binding protein
MDLNLVVLAGTLASDPEVRSFESGATLARYLVTVRSESPNRRLDVVPVTLWGPDENEVKGQTAGTDVWVAGSVQRRFWQHGNNGRSRLEVIAHEVTVRSPTEPWVAAAG